MAKNNVPFILKHVALAIYESGDVHGSSPTQKITGAMDIARHRLTEYGFFRKGSETGPIEKIKLTVKGMRGEQRHKYHGPRQKNEKFDALYSLIAEADNEEDDDTAGDPDMPDENFAGQDAREERKQVRHAHAARSAAGPKAKVRVPKRVKKAKAAQAKRARRR